MQPRERLLWIATRLIDHYGPPQIERPEPVASLVLTILSQNTNDANRDRAYASLLERFGTVEGVRTAPVDEIADAIRIGGLHRQKAVRIRAVLDRIHRERGRLDLSFLGELDLDQAMAWLLASPGVGHKTAGIVMLFSFDRPYFPVDTHIQRVLSRVGLIGAHEDPHDRVNVLAPNDSRLIASAHLLIIRLGRETCRPRTPSCSGCPIRRECDWAGDRKATKRRPGGLG